MAPVPTSAILTLCILVSGVTAQDGVTTEFLINNATTARGTTLVLRVRLQDPRINSGFWFRSPNILPNDRTSFQDIGEIYQIRITDIDETDAGEYYHVKDGGVTQGTVTVVESVINGAWGRWSEGTVTACPVTCGGSNRTRDRVRFCDDPAPLYGGKRCPGQSEISELEACGTEPCSERIQDFLDTMVAYRGQSVTLRYVHTEDIGRGQWFKDGILNNDDKYSQTSSGNSNFLTINDVQDPDAGLYIFFKGDVRVTGNLIVIDAPPEGICTGITLRNNVGFRYHPSDCDKYIQCYFNADGQELAVYQTCPFGHYWSMVTYRCEEHWKVDNCPVEKCSDSCGVAFKAPGSCGGYWDCTVTGPRPTCCPPGYGFFRGRGCLPTRTSGSDMCPSVYACRDPCMKRPVWTNSNQYEIFTGSQGWVEVGCEEGMYFDIGDCGCIKRDVPCDSIRNYTFNSNDFGEEVEATSVTSDGNYIALTNNSRFSINVRNIPTGSPRVIRFRYRHSGPMSELFSMTESQGHGAVAVYSGEDGLIFRFTAWTNCEEEMIISTDGMAASDWKIVTLWYDGRHMTAVVTSGLMKNRARTYAPNIVFLENRIHLGTTDSVMGALGSQSYTGDVMQTVPFNGQFDYVMIDACDGGLLV